MAAAVTPPVAETVAAGWVTVAEAAAQAGVLERTVRRWVAAGTVVSGMDADGRRRICPDSLPCPESASDTATPAASVASGPDTDTASGAASGAASGSPIDHEAERDLRRALDGARLAAKVAAQRMGQYRGEAEWLRRQLEQSRQAEAELRVLMLSQARTIEALQAPRVLAPAPESKRRWWWRWWG